MIDKTIMELPDFLKLSNKEISSLTGVHQSMISRYVQGKTAATETVLKKIGKPLGMRASMVLLGIELKREMLTNKSINENQDLKCNLELKLAA